ncbi:PucR family transcriptional regulator [Nocardioides humilatus]|uniref:PucR family transcriptional regulator n=1 Tax=Nocardioides humilatus TaxID=2607660 RepID=UPI00165FFA3F|nr:helix-turn-helix domain-containing protein [Nocardioides humilatus]
MGLSTAVVEVVAAHLPDLLDSPEALEANRASTEVSIRLFARIVEEGADPVTATHLEPATIEYAQDGARHGIPLTTLFRSYRLAHAATARHLTGILFEDVADPVDRNAAADLISAWLFAYVDVALCLVEEVYVEERDRWLRSAAASRAETIETLLAGRPVDQDAASRILKHELHRTHVAVIAWVDNHTVGRDTLTALDAAVRDVAGTLGTTHVLPHSLGTLSLAAWVSVKGGTDLAALDRIRLRSAADGVRVALGEAAAGVVGFRTSYLEAVQARRVARLAGSEVGSVTRYQQVALQALGSVDPEQSTAFVARELGPLFSDDEGARRLAQTLLTLLEEGGNRGRTGRRLNIHENTVSYRVRQAEELLGRSIDERPLDLALALKLAAVCERPRP